MEFLIGMGIGIVLGMIGTFIAVFWGWRLGK